MSLAYSIVPTPSYNPHTSFSSSPASSTMNFLRRLNKKRSDSQSSQLAASRPVPQRSTPDPYAPFRTTPPRRPRVNMELPPTYDESIKTNSPQPAANVPVTSTPPDDSPYAFLTQFDTIFLVDDSGSMIRRWEETSNAISAITPVCTAHDSDGIDIFFLNHRNHRRNSGLAPGGYTNVNDARKVQTIFDSVRPAGGTATGTRLNQILRPYLANYEANLKRPVPEFIKPINIIVITDGRATDDVESVIVSAARKLDTLEAEPWQVGIQFFQVGNAPEAADDLRELDDALSSQHNVRDIVDTVPWDGKTTQTTLSADRLLKIVLGSVNRRLDRRRVSGENQQRQ